MSLGILHANPKNKPGAVAWVTTTRGRWDSAGFAEVEQLTDELRRVPDTRLVVTDDTFDRARDTAILVDDARPSHGQSTRRVSRALGRRGSALNRVAPARTLVEARYGHPLAEELGAEGICHLDVHPPAGPKQLTAPAGTVAGRLRERALRRLTILREYIKVWSHVRRAARDARRAGYLVVITSDAQLSKTVHRPWAPRSQARRMGLASWSIGIDWLMFDRRLKLAGHPDVHQLFDHPGFIATLTARKAPR